MFWATFLVHLFVSGVTLAVALVAALLAGVHGGGTLLAIGAGIMGATWPLSARIARALLGDGGEDG